MKDKPAAKSLRLLTRQDGHDGARYEHVYITSWIDALLQSHDGGIGLCYSLGAMTRDVYQAAEEAKHG